jgi:NitT/TauT family transport system substrate-binding protein
MPRRVEGPAQPASQVVMMMQSRSSRRTFLARAVPAAFAALLVLLAGSRATQAQEPALIRVGALPTDGTSVVFYAKEMGYFERQGLTVEITTMGSGPAIAAAVAGGALDIGIANVATVAQARARGLPMRFIAPSSMADPTTMTDIVMVAANSTIRTGADLNGKIIAINGLKDLQQISASAWVDKHGGDSKTLHFVEIPIPQMAAAVEAHRADAALDVEPFVSIARARGQGKVIGDVLDGVGARYMVTGWLALDPWLATHADAATRFVLALRGAAEWANAHHHESGVILVKNSKISADLVDTMARAKFGTVLDPALLRPVIDGALRYGVLDAKPDLNDLIWHAPK